MRLATKANFHNRINNAYRDNRMAILRDIRCVLSACIIHLNRSVKCTINTANASAPETLCHRDDTRPARTITISDGSNVNTTATTLVSGGFVKTTPACATTGAKLLAHASASNTPAARANVGTPKFRRLNHAATNKIAK